jgi:nitroreductase
MAIAAAGHIALAEPKKLIILAPMNPVSPAQLLEQLNWRYATKQFDPTRKISATEWAALEQSLVLTPSSIGLQPWRFIVVDDPKVRAKLRSVSYDQSQVTDASHLVVLAAKIGLTEADVDAHIGHAAKIRGVEPAALAGLRAMALGSVVQQMNDAQRRDWAMRQTFIAAGVLLTSAAMLGIDACPMEGIEKPRYDEILGLSARGLSTAMIVTLGYRAATDKYAVAPKVRFPVSELVQHV